MSRSSEMIDKARAVLIALKEKGVEAVVTGSLAKGTPSETSDIDFLVVHCPRTLKYKIEALVEDTLHSSHFDLVYSEDAKAGVRATLEAHTLSLDQLPAS